MSRLLLVLFLVLYWPLASALVEVNEANRAELMQIKGIGPTLSSRIIEERVHGHFSDWRDFIQRVKGVGHKNSARFSEAGLVVNGASYRGVAITMEAESRARQRQSATP